MLSVFEHLKQNKAAYTNYAYNSEKFKDLLPKDLSQGARKKGLVFEPKMLTYWSEYFGQFEDIDKVDKQLVKTGMPGLNSKQERIHDIRQSNH